MPRKDVTCVNQSYSVSPFRPLISKKDGVDGQAVEMEGAQVGGHGLVGRELAPLA